MFLKQKVRNKYILIRKKKYFQVNQDFFKPLINLINKKKKKKISLYYPSNFEVDTIELFKILKKNKSISTMLPIISFNGDMKFIKWEPSEPLNVNRYGFLEPTSKKKKYLSRFINYTPISI